MIAMSRPHWPLFGCLALLAAWGSAAGQTQSPPNGDDEMVTHETARHFRTKVIWCWCRWWSAIRQGHAIGDLRKEDFQLFDRGKPQTISTFRWRRSPARCRTAKDRDAARAAAVEEEPAAVNPGRCPQAFRGLFLRRCAYLPAI